MSSRITSKRALANQQLAAQQKRMSRFGRSVLVLLATILSFGAFALLAADQIYRPDKFVIDQLKLTGNFNHIKPKQIEGIVNKHSLGNFFSIKLSDIKDRIEELAWVQNADVRREWPNTLLIDIEEQQPIMRWQDDLWVNGRGQIIDLPGQLDMQDQITLSGNKQHSHLMLEQTTIWQQMLVSSGLMLSELALSESRAYVVTLRYESTTDEFNLLLGRDQVKQRFERFLMLYEHHYKHSGQRLKRVDARYPDGLAIEAIDVEPIDAEPIDLGHLNVSLIPLSNTFAAIDKKVFRTSLIGDQL